MSEWFWERMKLYSGWIASLILLGLIVFVSNIEIKDSDLWLHLASGRHIIQNLQIPRVDFLSCTIPGKMWINHEWFFQVVVSSIYQLSGVDGLINMQVMIVGVTFALLFLLGYNKKNVFLQVFLLFLVLIVYQSRMTHRPDIFSLLLMVLYIQVLAYCLNNKSVWLLLFVLQVLWTNIHGFFILGPILVLLSCVAEFLKRNLRLPFQWNTVGRLNDHEYFNLKVLIPIAIAACFVNPHFIDGVIYPLKVLFSLSGDSKIFFSDINELKKPIMLNNVMNMKHYLEYKVLILISFASFVVNRKKIDVGLLILWIAFLLFSLSATRNVVFFSFAAYLVTTVNLLNIDIAAFFVKSGNVKMKNILSMCLSIIVVVMMLAFAKDLSLNGYYDFDKLERKSEMGGISLRNYPHKAVNFLIKNNVSGNFFNDFNSGAYLLGRRHPHIKVFIDGRTEVYGSAFYKKHIKSLLGNTELFESAVEQFDLSGVFLGSVIDDIPGKLIKYLYESEEWVLVYFDYDALIFLKNNHSNAMTIQKSAIDLSNYKTTNMDLVKIGSKNILPYRYINRTIALLHIGFFDKAAKEAEEALRIAPYYNKPYQLLGKIAKKKEDYSSAYEYFRIARILNSSDRYVDLEIALTLCRNGNYFEAEEAYSRAKRRGAKQQQIEANITSCLASK